MTRRAMSSTGMTALVGELLLSGEIILAEAHAMLVAAAPGFTFGHG